MLPVPAVYNLVAGSGEGHTPLTAFDRALLQAGIGNVNIIRVSSILPSGAVYKPDLQIPPGSLVPSAYGYIASEQPGSIIAAAVGVGIAEDGFGVIMEHAGFLKKEEAEQIVCLMVQEAFKVRGLTIAEFKSASAEHRVKKAGCALAAVTLWY